MRNPTLRANHDNRKCYFLVAIFLISIAVRIITAEYVDIGGDNSEKWRQVHQLVDGLGYSVWYQQTARWAIMLPLAGIMKTFGLNPVLTYVMPIFFASLAAVCICLIGERLHSLKLGIVASMATILFPQMAQTGSQLWPGVFELGYLSLCVLLILRWLDTRITAILILAALAFFFGFGSRVTVIYSIPGLALLIWLPSKDFKALLLFCMTIGTLCLIEWAIFWQATGNPMGRLGIIQGSHLISAGLEISLRDYLLNIKSLVKLKGLIAIWVLCLIASIHVFLIGDKKWRAIAVMYFIHAFLLLYMISSISPLKLAMPVGTRFWGVIAPFGLLILFKSLFELQRICPRTARIAMTILFLVFIAFSIKKIPPVNSLVQLNRDYHLLAPLLKARQPMLMRYEHWQPNFIEEYVISAFTGKKGKRIPREDHVIAAIYRNHARLVALFLEDISQFEAYVDTDRLTRVEYTIFLFTPPGAPANAQPAAEIVYGRKLHAARPLP